MQLQTIIKQHRLQVPLLKWDNRPLFMPTWLVLLFTLTCVIVSIAAIRIEADTDTKTIIIETVKTEEPKPAKIEKIQYYEYVVNTDTLIFQEDNSHSFKRQALKAVEQEAQTVSNIIEKLKKMGIKKDSFLILAELRPETRKQLFLNVPASFVEAYAPTIEINHKKIQIHPARTSPDTKKEDEGKKLDFGIYTEEQARAYISRFLPVAKIQKNKYGIPVSITLAQGLHESNAGKSRLARNNNNHFGIKCFNRNCSKGHCTNYTDDSHKDFFRTYTSAWESYESHSIFLTKKRYKHLLKLSPKDYKSWAKGLQKAGYATDKKYANKLIKTIEKFKLNQYD